MINRILVVLLSLVALDGVGTARAAGDLTGYDRVNVGNGNVLSAGATWGNVLGKWNTNESPQSTIAGGYQNHILGNETEQSFIGAGIGNYVGTYNSSIIAGGYNSILEDAYNSCIGGGILNVLSNLAAYCTIGGGVDNVIGSNCSACVIGAGRDNRIYYWNNFSTIAGGIGNEIHGISPWQDPPNIYSTISGGNQNIIWTNCQMATIAGGGVNEIKNSSSLSAIGGGSGNVIGTNSPASVIGGGGYNTVGPNASYGTIGGGGGGQYVTGFAATVPGGWGNIAVGTNSFAAGTYAWAAHDGCFVWGDSAPHYLYSSGSNQFVARASGGFWFGNSSGTISIPSGHFIETTTGAYLTTAGVWQSVSDRNAKRNFDPIKATEVLEQVAELPISSWSYKVEDPSVRHIGPMAQDFYAAFRLGQDDRSIGALDETGVALAAIQGLNQIVKEKEAEISTLRVEVAELRKRAIAQQEAMAKWDSRLAALEKAEDAALTAQLEAGKASFAESDR